MARVVVLGSSGYDLTVRLPRLPREGETILGGELLRGPGGKGANAAVAARRAGAEVIFLTAFGDDEFGRELRQHDLREGLDLTHARLVSGVANQVALIFVGESDGRNQIAVAPGASARYRAADVDALPDSVFDGPGVFLACLELPSEAVWRGLARASGSGLRTVVNPAPADQSFLDGGDPACIDVLTPNREELRELTGQPVASDSEVSAAARLLRRRGVTWVVVTLGEAGCLVVGADGEARLPGHLIEAVDTVGAGDAFNGALAVALAEGRELPAAARFATAAGALAVTRVGAQGGLPSRCEIEQFLTEA